jgi:hypothetical protein
MIIARAAGCFSPRILTAPRMGLRQKQRTPGGHHGVLLTAQQNSKPAARGDDGAAAPTGKTEGLRVDGQRAATMWLRNTSSRWHASGERSTDAAAMEKEGVGAVLGKESQQGKACGHGGMEFTACCRRWKKKGHRLGRGDEAAGFHGRGSRAAGEGSSQPWGEVELSSPFAARRGQQDVCCSLLEFLGAGKR